MHLTRPLDMFPPSLLFEPRPVPYTPAVPCNSEQGPASTVKLTYEAGWLIVGGLILQTCNHLQCLLTGSTFTELQCHPRITATLKEFECSVSFTMTVYVDFISCVLDHVKLVFVHSASYDCGITKKFTSLHMSHKDRHLGSRFMDIQKVAVIATTAFWDSGQYHFFCSHYSSGDVHYRSQWLIQIFRPVRK